MHAAVKRRRTHIATERRAADKLAVSTPTITLSPISRQKYLAELWNADERQSDGSEEQEPTSQPADNVALYSRDEQGGGFIQQTGGGGR